MLESSVIAEIRGILLEPDLERKLTEADRLCRRRDLVGNAGQAAKPLDPLRPARPSDWTVLPPHEIPDRPRLTTPEGRYRLLHAVGHIELSAVELALATSALFPAEEAAFHRDWLRVAGEEVDHTRLVLGRLASMGGTLGTDPVHLGLWEASSGLRGLVARLAVVPRIQEARGLDVSARLRTQLATAGDLASAEVLETIYRDEIGHVAVGTHWFRVVCRREGVDPEARFLGLLEEFRLRRGLRPGPIDRDGRLAAGFTQREIEALAGSPDQRPEP